MANRYWVGGTNTWNTTAGTKWATTSGGAGGATVPGAADDVFFDAASGAATVTWASGASTTVLRINCTGFTGTLATAGNNKTLAGTGTVWTSPSTCTITGTPTLTVNSTGSTAISVTCNHASPSSSAAPNFSFTGGTYALTLSGAGFRALTFTGSSCTASGSISMYQNLTLSSGGTFTSLAPTFLATASVTSVGKTLGNTTVNTAAGTVTLVDAMTAGTTNTTTLTAGTLALANFTLSTGIFSSSGSSTRAITFGSGNIALTSTTAATTVLSMATATNFTWTGTGGFTRNMAATATVVFGTTGGTTSNAPNLTVNAGASALTITSGSYFKDVIFTGSTSTVTATPLNLAGSLTLASGGTYTSVVPTFRGSATVTSNGKELGAVTINGSGITVTLADLMAVSNLAFAFTLTQGTLNLAGNFLFAPRFSSSGSNTRAINFGTGGRISLSERDVDLFRMDTATGFTWSGTGEVRLTGGSGVGRFSFGATGGATSSNVLDLVVATSGGLVVEFPNGSSAKSITCLTGNPSLQTITGTTNLYGNLTLVAGAGSSYAAFSPTFLASGTIASAGKSLNNVTVNGSGITVTLADAMTLGAASTFTLTQGTFDAANFTVTTAFFSSSNTNTRAISMGSSTWAISGSGATAWNTATATNLTVTPSTSTITMTSASAKTFAGGGVTYYNLNQGGAGTLTISGSNTFNNITNSTQPATVTFTAGTTQTVSAFGLSGTAGNLITINSTTPGSQFTLSDASGTINAQYLAIQDSNATGGAVWNALYSTNLGNNTGWIFPGGNMFLMFM
jgi:hypothetical protein